jgi:phage-related minor tail protein
MLKRGYIILIVGAVMLVTAVVISALSAGPFAGQFLRDNIIISHATIRPSESVTEVLQVRRQVSLALHSEAESTNTTIRETIRDPISKIVNAKEFPKDYFTTFKPNSTGDYTLTLTNLGTNIINIDGVFGFLPFVGENQQVNFSPLIIITIGAILFIIGIVVLIIGVVIVIVDRRRDNRRTPLTR